MHNQHCFKKWLGTNMVPRLFLKEWWYTLCCLKGNKDVNELSGHFVVVFYVVFSWWFVIFSFQYVIFKTYSVLYLLMPMSLTHRVSAGIILKRGINNHHSKQIYLWWIISYQGTMPTTSRTIFSSMNQCYSVYI